MGKAQRAPVSASRSQLEAALARTHALLEAVRLISAGGHDLDATLDALGEQARGLFGAVDAVIHLAAAGGEEFVRGRVGSQAAPGSPLSVPGSIYRPDAFMREAFARGRPLFARDYQADPRISSDIKVNRPAVASSMAVPLLADGERVGVLVMFWTAPREEDERLLAAAEALGRHAAVAIRTHRLIADRARLEAERARLDGAVKMGRLVAHELNNQLQFLVGYGGMLAARLAGDEGEMAREMLKAAQDMSALVDRLGRIARFEETDVGGGAMLDLEAATAEPSP